jgi:antibiotic biosynthesis monooxygenase (ABM) superfamily enzyme
MIKHIVMWKLKDFAEGSGKEENARKIKEQLESLQGTIPEIKHIEAGINVINTDSSADVVLYSEFENMESLNAYQKHPEHVKIVQFVRNVCTERRVVDYTISE